MVRSTSTTRTASLTAMAPPKKRGTTEVVPHLTYVCAWNLELEPHADTEVKRRLELRRVARQHGSDRLAEVRIGGPVRQLRVLVIREHAPLVEQVEHVGEQRHAPRA